MDTSEIVLATDRLYLRPFKMDDAPLLVNLDSDPEVMRHISKGKPTSLEQIENVFLPRTLELYTKQPPQGFWAAHERGSDAFLGWFHLRPQRSAPFDMELGYRLYRKYWGQGYATEGSRALLAKGFSEWDAPRIMATTLVGNRASQRVMEKCGLRFETEFFYDASLLPGWTQAERRAVQYGISKAEFDALTQEKH